MSKIIVLTPVKNEAWILHRFLQVCSLFADYIIIADQNSTDESLDIYKMYPKVTLVMNKTEEFDEAGRQLLLLNTAREKFGLNNILLAIDADEILAADAMQTIDWKVMLRAKPGTILYFEKPTFYKDTSVSIRYDSGGWPLGYVDDGAPHFPSPIHSVRIPTPEYAQKLYLNNIKFLHYALVRLDAQASKQRMYSMLENLKGTKKLRHRLRLYNSKLDFTNEGDRREPSNPSWFLSWEEKGIDMHTISHSNYYWYDYECLKLFKKYGERRFMFDDIWDFDWESFRLKSIQQNYVYAPDTPITPPYPILGILVTKYLKLIDKGLSSLKTNNFHKSN